MVRLLRRTSARPSPDLACRRRVQAPARLLTLIPLPIIRRIDRNLCEQQVLVDSKADGGTIGGREDDLVETGDPLRGRVSGGIHAGCGRLVFVVNEYGTVV